MAMNLASNTRTFQVKYLFAGWSVLGTCLVKIGEGVSLGRALFDRFLLLLVPFLCFRPLGVEVDLDLR